MTAAPLKSAMIGCGAIAHEHARFLRSSPRAELVAVVDRSAAVAEFFRRHYGARACYSDAAAMLAETPVDVVHVLTPPGTHEQLIRMALDAGCHVVCEKPMADGAKATQALLDHAAACGRMLVESNNAIWNRNVRELRELVTRGALGEIREVEIALAVDVAAGHFGDLNLGTEGVQLAGGAVHDFLPHMCGLFLTLAGGHDVERVEGRLANLSGNARVKFDFLDCRLGAGPVRGYLRMCPDTKPASFRIAVRGTLGSAETEQFNPYVRTSGGRYEGKLAPLDLIQSGRRLIGAGFRNFSDKIAGITPYHGLDAMLDAVYAAIQHGDAPPVTREYMVSVAALTERIVALGERDSA